MLVNPRLTATMASFARQLIAEGKPADRVALGVLPSRDGSDDRVFSVGYLTDLCEWGYYLPLMGDSTLTRFDPPRQWDTRMLECHLVLPIADLLAIFP